MKRNNTEKSRSEMIPFFFASNFTGPLKKEQALIHIIVTTQVVSKKSEKSKKKPNKIK